MEFPSNDYFHPVTIGSLRVRGNLFFAPMAGYTDHITRALGYFGGADVCMTEMISAEGLARHNSTSGRLLTRYSPGLFSQSPDSDTMLGSFLSSFREEPLYVQLFAAGPEALIKAAEILNTTYRPSIVDLNCGCPMPKICRFGAGAALMRNPALIGEMIKALKSVLECPVTVKIRSGYSQGSLSYPRVIEQALIAGVDAITLHPRTQDQGYSGNADWSCIRHAVQIVGGNIPLIGNGDLNSPQDAKRMLEETGCDGLMFARTAVKNPEIFHTAKSFLCSRSVGSRPDAIEYARAHLKLAVDWYGERLGSTTMKKRLAAYVSGLPGSAELRKQLVTAPDSATMSALLARIQD
ncbi:MAG: tRNA-dihydrouridine synthase [Spirochaetales bacterium]|nr:tRNA-dihydrouridine synthase [Spirochaetales bacterium]